MTSYRNTLENLDLDYEQSLCFLIVRRERSEKNKGRAKAGQLSRGLFFFAPLSADYKKTKGLLVVYGEPNSAIHL